MFGPLNTHRFLAFPLPLLDVEAVGLRDFWLLSSSAPSKFVNLSRHVNVRVISNLQKKKFQPYPLISILWSEFEAASSLFCRPVTSSSASLSMLA